MDAGIDDWVAVIVEDEPDVSDLLDTILTQSGFRTVVAADGREGIEAVRTHEPLLTTLDVNMPGMDGFAAARRIREFSQTYLIMVTGLGDEIDIVAGLEAGADDYLVKPVRPRELRARAESMLRRPRQRSTGAPAPAVSTPPPAPRPAVPPGYRPPPTAAAVEPTPPPSNHSEPDTQPEGGRVQVGDLAVDTEQRVASVADRPVDLTPVEIDLLASLLVSGRRVRSKADLVLTMRGQDEVTAYFVNEADKRQVEAHIDNIRRKIGDDASSPRWIETVRGVGYRLGVPD